MIEIALYELKIIQRNRTVQIATPLFLLLLGFMVSPYNEPGDFYGKALFFQLVHKWLIFLLFPLVSFLIGDSLKRDKTLGVNEIIVSKPFFLFFYILGKIIGGVVAVLGFILLPGFLLFVSEKILLDIEGANNYLFLLKLFYYSLVKPLPLVVFFVTIGILIGSVLRNKILFYWIIFALWIFLLSISHSHYFFLILLEIMGLLLLYFWASRDLPKAKAPFSTSIPAVVAIKMCKPLLIFFLFIFLIPFLLFYSSANASDNVISKTFEIVIPFAMAVSMADIFQREKEEKVMEIILAKPSPIQKLVIKRVFTMISLWFLFLAFFIMVVMRFKFSLSNYLFMIALSIPSGIFFISLILLVEILVMKTPVAYATVFVYAMFWLNSKIQFLIPENGLFHLLNPFFYTFHQGGNLMWVFSKGSMLILGMLVIFLSLFLVGKRTESLIVA